MPARSAVTLDVVELPAEASELRADVREFLSRARETHLFEPRCDSWISSHSPEFSRELARRGWIGMTLPTRYGGAERSATERFVVVEELLAAGAPVAAHWFADRQSAGQILRHGSDMARKELLPRIVAGECFFAIGMSESESGSDLASVRTAARRAEGGWLISGTKLWTSHAHRSHYMTTLCRTSPPGATRHDGLSVLMIDLATAGVTVRQIPTMMGAETFNEVILEDAFVPDSMMLGGEGDGWRLITSELSLERSGPERFLSVLPLYLDLVDAIGPHADAADLEALGRLTGALWTLRRMSLGVSAALDRGRDPVAEAALVKDVGTRFEGGLVEVARGVSARRQMADPRSRQLEPRLAETLLASPGFTLRGGTNEILRGIVCRALGATA